MSALQHVDEELRELTKEDSHGILGTRSVMDRVYAVYMKYFMGWHVPKVLKKYAYRIVNDEEEYDLDLPKQIVVTSYHQARRYISNEYYGHKFIMVLVPANWEMDPRKNHNPGYHFFLHQVMLYPHFVYIFAYLPPLSGLKVFDLPYLDLTDEEVKQDIGKDCYEHLLKNRAINANITKHRIFRRSFYTHELYRNKQIQFPLTQYFDCFHSLVMELHQMMSDETHEDYAEWAYQVEDFMSYFDFLPDTQKDFYDTKVYSRHDIWDFPPYDHVHLRRMDLQGGVRDSLSHKLGHDDFGPADHPPDMKNIESNLSMVEKMEMKLDMIRGNAEEWSLLE